MVKWDNRHKLTKSKDRKKRKKKTDVNIAKAWTNLSFVILRLHRHSSEKWICLLFSPHHTVYLWHSNTWKYSFKWFCLHSSRVVYSHTHTMSGTSFSIYLNFEDSETKKIQKIVQVHINTVASFTVTIIIILFVFICHDIRTSYNKE